MTSCSSSADGFPLFVARVGGLPASTAENFSTPALRQAIERVFRCDEAVRASSAAAGDALYAVIGAESDPASRSSLVRLRRDIFNARALRPVDIAVGIKSMDGQAAPAMHALALAYDSRTDALTSLRTAHDDALRLARERIQCALREPRFLDGLLLSSRSLFRNIPRYVRASHGRLGARDLQIERGLLRYLTRASMKATPFASFCTIVAGRFVHDSRATATHATVPGTPYLQCGSITPRRNLVRLNKSLYATLWDFIKKLPATRYTLIVELNPTLRECEERLVFLASESGSEIFQRMEITEVLTLVVATLRSRGGCEYSEIAALLAGDERVEATLDEARQFIDALLQIGMLRFRNLVPSQEADWLLPLANAVQHVADEQIAILVRTLRELEATVRAFGDADSDSRISLTERIHAAIVEVSASLGLRAGREEGLPLYEDCSACLEIQIRRSPEVQRAMKALRGFMERLIPIAYPRAEMATMRHFYDTHYADRSEPVSLLTFYEDFYREHFKEHLSKEARIRRREVADDLTGYNLRNPFKLESINRLDRAATAWAEAVRTCWRRSPDAEELHLAPSDIPTVSDIPPRNPSVPLSAAIFCQIASHGDGCERTTRIITDSGRILLGFGKYFSRFMELFPPAFTDAIVARNTELGADSLAEIAGDSNFNANFHPRLLPLQVAYPSGDGEGEQATVLCSDIVVTRDPVDPSAIYLMNARTGRRLQPLDLGFLNPRMRPPLYQLLMRFAPLAGHQVPLPVSLDADDAIAPSAAARIVYRPRIVYDECVVLSRRRWIIPSTLFPNRAPTEADYAYFIRLNEWRRDHGIPAAVYVRVMPRRPASPAEPNSSSNEESMVGQSYHEADGGIEVSPPSDDDADDTTSVAFNKFAASKREPGMQLKPDSKQRYSRDFIKPQFIDFESPLLADLFGRLPGPLSNFTLQIEERYPDHDALPVIDGEAYVTELILQLDWPTP